MNAKKTPLQQVNEEHGGKIKLVDSLVGSLAHGDEDKDSLKARLLKASNKKLLRLSAVTHTIREKYGSTEKLVEAVGQKLNRVKDSDFLRRLGEHTPAKLLDLARSLAGERRRPLPMGVVARPAEKRAAPAAVKRAAAAKGKTGKPAAKTKATAAKSPAAKKRVKS